MCKFLAALALFAIPVYSQVPVSLLQSPWAYLTDNNGKPCVGCKLWTYAAGTTTPQITYTDSAGTVAATNPIILDGAGRQNIWITSALYKIVLETAVGTPHGTVLKTQDNVSSATFVNVAFPITIPKGGTGVGSLPAGILTGHGTSPITAASNATLNGNLITQLDLSASDQATNLKDMPAPYQAMASGISNAVNPAPWQITRGSIASPTTDAVPPILCQTVASVNTTGIAAPACILGYAIAGGPGGLSSSNNVIAVEGIAQVNAGDLAGNAVGGVGVTGYAQLNTSVGVGWGGWFIASDSNFAGGLAGIEVNTVEGNDTRSPGLHEGINVVNIDNSAGTHSVTNDWGVVLHGYGQGVSFSADTNPGTAFTFLNVRNSASGGNTANTSILTFDSGQPGPFNVGLDFTNATFTDSAIKAASLKRPRVLDGLNNGNGLEHFSICAGGACDVTATPCSTAASAGATCTTTITMPITMVDIVYQTFCSGVGAPVGIPSISNAAKLSGSQFNLQIQAATNQASTWPEVDCIVVHN